MSGESAKGQDAPSAQDIHFMQLAIEQAELARLAGDVPVGAVIVFNGQLISRGHNRRQQSGDPTAHAEVLALRRAAGVIGNWRIEGTLYVTQEPCPMCAGALVNARITRLVYGCPNPKAGAIDSLFELVTDPRLNHRMKVSRGVLAKECAGLLKTFFACLRQDNARRKTNMQDDK